MNYPLRREEETSWRRRHSTAMDAGVGVRRRNLVDTHDEREQRSVSTLEWERAEEKREAAAHWAGVASKCEAVPTKGNQSRNEGEERGIWTKRVARVKYESILKIWPFGEIFCVLPSCVPVIIILNGWDYFLFIQRPQLSVLNEDSILESSL